MRADDRTIRQHITTPEDGLTALAGVLWGPTGRPPEWHRRAACRDTAGDEWFDKASRSRARRLNNRYCSTCPVRAECAEDILTWEREVSLGAGIVAGHVAGLNASDRRALLTKPPQRVNTHTAQDHHAA